MNEMLITELYRHILNASLRSFRDGKEPTYIICTNSITFGVSTFLDFKEIDELNAANDRAFFCTQNFNMFSPNTNE